MPPNDKVVIRRLKAAIAVVLFALVALSIGVAAHRSSQITGVIVGGSLSIGAFLLAIATYILVLRFRDWREGILDRIKALEEAQQRVPQEVANVRMLSRIEHLATQVNTLSRQVLRQDDPLDDPPQVVVQPPSEAPSTNTWFDRIAKDDE
jgi:HAMP domain-containing protein